MRELAIRNVATEMRIRGALTEPFEPRVIRMEILYDRNQHPISPAHEPGSMKKNQVCLIASSTIYKYDYIPAQ